MRRAYYLVSLAGVVIIASVAAVTMRSGCRRAPAVEYRLVEVNNDPVRKIAVYQVIVPAGVTRDQVVALVRQLKREWPDYRMYSLSIFDDATQAARQFDLSDQAAESDPSFWEHYLAQYNCNSETGLDQLTMPVTP